jgi:hypothetical protein
MSRIVIVILIYQRHKPTGPIYISVDEFSYFTCKSLKAQVVKLRVVLLLVLIF